ncbi:MAG: penicillin-binding protein, partial [Solirubrobacteraceae bacterium]|nr:penicillin-binding protein [Solirubrobacteraceae bacterium]
MSRSTRTRRRRARRTTPRSKILLGFGVVLAILGVAGLSAVGYVVSIAASAPPLDSLKPRDPGGFSLVLDRNGHKLGVIQARDLRKEIPSEQIPQNLKDATVAIEDARFYKHKGVDYLGVVRAAVKNLESGKQVQGGSTITMQLIRTLYGSQEKSYKRKIREAKLAEELENEHSKEWILTKYLNTVPYGTYGGQTALGVWAASKTYFNKPPRKLSLAQAAMLAGLPQAPSEYSPVRSPQAAKSRRNEVLDAMAKVHMISDVQADEAKASPLQLDMSKYFQRRREDYFFDYVKDQLYQAFPQREVRRGGLRVFTTIDPKKQELARSAIAGRIAGIGPSAAIVTIDPSNGEILTMASSSDYGKSKFNLAAQGHRQPGSSFKVMALMTALRRGVDPDSTYYTSKPLNFDDPTYGHIETKTYDGSYSGSISLHAATLKSDNSVYMQLALDLGPENIKQTAEDMGITTKLDGFPAETLGGLTLGVSPLEMADAYATIASGGVWHKPIAITKIRKPDGTVLKGDKLPKKLRPEAERRFQDGVTAKATEILEDNVQGGTGIAAATGCPAAGKTGTTDEHSDGWFVGFTPRLASAVWVGYPDANVHMYTEYHGGPVAGGTFPAEIWGDYTQSAMGSFCGTFAPAEHPMTFTRFYGGYASSGRSSTSTGGYT